MIKQKLKNEKLAWTFVACSIFIVLFYKYYKYVAIRWFPTAPDGLEYFWHQSIFTIYRIMATIIGFFFIKYGYVKPQEEIILKKSRLSLFLLLLLIPCYFLLRWSFSPFQFDPKSFSFELFFNFFTGTYEELLFRGVLLTGLFALIKSRWAIILSAALFSLWHYDVVGSRWEFVVIFLWGMLAGFAFFKGASLLTLSLLHFLWDQVYFGFYWLNEPTYIFYYAESVLLILSILIVEKYLDYKK